MGLLEIGTIGKAHGLRGEVLVRLGGQPVKLSALASDGSDDSFANGAEVVVVSVVSPTRVRVMAADRFWTTQ